MLIQDLNHLETASEKIEGALSADALAQAFGQAFGGTISYSDVFTDTYAEAFPGFNLSIAGSGSVSYAIG